MNVPDTSSVQDEVRLAEAPGLTRSDPDYYALQLGNHILSGAFCGTRQYHDLREEAGFVYTVESELDVGKTRSIFEIDYACDPQTVVKARELLLNDLRQMQAAPVTDSELQQAMTLAITRMLLGKSCAVRARISTRDTAADDSSGAQKQAHTCPSEELTNEST